MGIFPRIHEPRRIARSPTEILDAFDVRRLFIELAHSIDSERLEGFAIAAAIREHIEEGEDLREAGTGEGHEVVREGAAAMRCGDGGDGEDAEGAVGEVRR